MDGVLVIGLPVKLRKRTEDYLKPEGLYLSNVPADIGKMGTMQLLPHPSDAIYKLREYYDNSENAFVVVLPYAPIPEDLGAELATLEELGAEIVYVAAGKDDWPVLKKRVRPDDSFNNKVFKQLIIEIFGDEEEDVPPSKYIESLFDKNPKLIITAGALDTCDQVAEHRRDFLKTAADALVKLVAENGIVGPMDAFFKSQGLEHAQTGGIDTMLTVSRNDVVVHQKTANTHLKQGDKTTPQAAARIYYQEFFVERECYVALMYAGPHPESNIKRECRLS